MSRIEYSQCELEINTGSGIITTTSWLPTYHKNVKIVRGVHVRLEEDTEERWWTVVSVGATKISDKTAFKQARRHANYIASVDI
jgi:hypothetical protein